MTASGALVSALLVGIATGAAGQSSTDAARLQLVRCARANDAPCLQTGFALAPRERALVAASDSSQESARWHGSLGGLPLMGPGVAASSVATAPVRLFILVDRGRAMAGEGIAFTRVALRSWLGTLNPRSYRVAVAGFDGRDVNGAIDSAAFGAPRVASAAVDRLPSADAKGRSPVYSAVVEAVRRIRLEAGSAPRAETGLLLVAGRGNDVGPGREGAGLLAGADGLAEAAAAVATSGARIWIMTLTPGDTTDDLQTLAGPVGTVITVAPDPNVLTARFAAITREFLGARALTFGVNGIGSASLARTAMTGAAIFHASTGGAITRMVSWRPPLMALPAFQGIADSTALALPLRDALLAGSNTGSNRPLIALLMGIVVAALWILGPRLGWTEPIVERVPRRESATTVRLGAATSATAEGAPRRPEDITHQTARRTALNR